jgi:hypothetical protein
MQWLFACGLPQTLADTCINIDNPETFRQWASATQKQHQNWMHKRAIHSEYGQTQSCTEQPVGNRFSWHCPTPGNTPHPQLLPHSPDTMDTSAAIHRVKTEAKKEKHHLEGRCYKCSKQGHVVHNCPNRKTLVQARVVDTQESEAMTPHWIAKILQAYNNDKCDLFIKVMQEEDDKMGFSSCLGTMALIQACNSPNSVYVAKKKSIHASLLLHTSLKRAMKKALLDTGATENFIHLRVVKQLSLKTKKLTKLWKVKNVDGTLNQSGEITDVVTLIVMHNGRPM